MKLWKNVYSFYILIKAFNISMDWKFDFGILLYLAICGKECNNVHIGATFKNINDKSYT